MIYYKKKRKEKRNKPKKKKKPGSLGNDNTTKHEYYWLKKKKKKSRVACAARFLCISSPYFTKQREIAKLKGRVSCFCVWPNCHVSLFHSIFIKTIESTDAGHRNNAIEVELPIGITFVIISFVL